MAAPIWTILNRRPGIMGLVGRCAYGVPERIQQVFVRRHLHLNTTNISTIPQFPLAGNNRYRDGTSSVTLFIDKVEWFYQISGNNPVTRRFIQTTNGSSSSFQAKSFSRINLHPPISGFMSRLSFIIRTLCPSTSLVPASFQV